MTSWVPFDLLDHLWQSTLVTAVIWLIARAVRTNAARVRYWLWFAASVKFLVPWTVLASAGSLVAWPHAPAPMRTLVASSAARTAQLPFVAWSIEETPMVAPPAEATWIAPVLLHG